MSDVPSDAAQLPLLMTTGEVCALGRMSVRTLSRRLKDGVFELQPVGRGREKLYRRDDVLRVFGLVIRPASAVSQGQGTAVVDPVAIRAARAAQTRRKPKSSI